MKLPRCSAIGLAVIAMNVLAQTPPSHVGKWRVEWMDAQGRQREAHLDLRESDGSYRILTLVQRGRPDPCITVQAPVAVETPSEQQLVVAILRSNVMAGCTDSKLTLQKAADGGYAGSFATGTPVVVKPR